MKYFFVVIMLIPAIMIAQSKPPTVVKPQYNQYDFNSDTNTGNEFNVFNNLLIETDSDTTTATETPVVSQIEITTEIGSTTVPLQIGSSSEIVEETRLSSVVERINQDYEIAEQECKNGSWLEQIWCRITNWW